MRHYNKKKQNKILLALYYRCSEFTAGNIRVVTFLGWHPKIGGTSIKNNFETLWRISNANGAIILCLKLQMVIHTLRKTFKNPHPDNWKVAQAVAHPIHTES